jgi:hypothetical protein
MDVSSEVLHLISETISAYVSRSGIITTLASLPMTEEERGWSGAELPRYAVGLHTGTTVSLIPKRMPLVEWTVGAHLTP